MSTYPEEFKALEEENERLKENLLYYVTNKNRAVECSCGKTFYAPFDDLECPFCEGILKK